MTSSRFATLAEVAVELRYADALDGLTPKALYACRRWLSSRGVRPSLRRGLYRWAAIDLAIEQEDFKAVKARKQRGSNHANFGSGSRRHCTMKTPNGEAVPLHNVERAQ